MKNYLIIGGSSGIGKSLAEILSENANVFATFCKTELSHPAINYFYHEASEKLNLEKLPEVIDGLAYCIGSIQLKPFHRFTEEDYIKDYQLQVLGAVKVIQDILPRLKQSSCASIVSIFYRSGADRVHFPQFRFRQVRALLRGLQRP
jgi:NAD(P)-dependent dehydrogenase (short-subunit alcohol dehydrogenase family)